MKIYLCGAISGCSDFECAGWREYVTQLVGKDHVLNPLRRDFRGREWEHIDEIVELDKEDIDNATHVLVYLDQDRPFIGTAMEMLYAWERGVPVIAVVDPRVTVLSPWLFYHSKLVIYADGNEEIYRSIERAVDYIKNDIKR